MNAHKNFRPVFVYALLITSVATALTACGPASDKVNIKLRTGLETAKQFPNLMNGLQLNALPFTTAGICKQKNLYAVVDTTPDKTGSPELDTFRIDTDAAFDTTAYSIDYSWARSYLAFPRGVNLPIPRGTAVEVGIIGSLSASTMHDAGQLTCADFDSLNSYTPFSTTSVIGHRRIIANESIDLPLNVWLLGANETAAPQPVSPSCAGLLDEGQTCPGKDFAKLTCAACNSNSYHLRVEYVSDRIHPEQRVIQWIPTNDIGPGDVYIPDILPIRVFISTSGANGPIDIGKVEFADIDFASTPSGVSVTKTASNGTAISLVKQ